MSIPAVYHREYYSNIGMHVFPTKKFALVYEGLKQRIAGFESRLHHAVPATRTQMLRVHTAEYLDDLDAHEHTLRTRASELPLSSDIIAAYYLMTGGSCLAARLALEHRGAMNLGGGFHHAFADRAEGFCYANDVAVAAREILASGAVQRGVVIDTDLHQGNGTARIFLGDPSVFTFSIHQQHNYPVKAQSDLDVGLEDGVGDDEYLSVLDKSLERIFLDFKPQFAIYVGGVDPYLEDQLGGLRLTKEGIRDRDTLVFRYCREGNTPVAALLAGGYAHNVQDTVDMHINTYLAMSSVLT